MFFWQNTAFWVALALVLGIVDLYRRVKPTRDYYVLQRKSYNRLLQPPWRGDLFGTNYSSFEEYGAAKAAFEIHESYLDSLGDAENFLFVVSARSKSDAIGVVTKGRFNTELLHSTPRADVLRRNEMWKLDAQVLAEESMSDLR